MPKKNKNKSPFTKPLTRKSARKEIKAAGRLAVGDEQRILKAERRTSKVQSRRIRDWFPQYGQAVGQAAQRTAGAYQGADQQIASASDASTNYAETLRQRLAQEGMADAQKRGVQYDPSGSNVGAQAQLARINSSDTLRGVTASQGAAQGAYYADKQRIGQREKIEQLLQEQERRRSYTQDLRDLAKRKSDTMIQERGRLRDSERDYHLGLLAARGNKRSARISAQNSRRSAATTRRGQNITRQNSIRSARTSRQNSKRANAPDGGGGDRRERKQDIRQAMAKIRNHESSAKPKDQFSSRKEAMDYLEAAGVPRGIAKRAIKRLLNKGKGNGPHFDDFH